MLLALNRTYVEPYTSPLGQVLLAVLLCGYVGALLWMRQMTAGQPAPRFLAASTDQIEGRLANPAARVAPLTVTADRTADRTRPAGVRTPLQRSGQQ